MLIAYQPSIEDEKTCRSPRGGFILNGWLRYWLRAIKVINGTKLERTVTHRCGLALELSEPASFPHQKHLDARVQIPRQNRAPLSLSRSLDRSALLHRVPSPNPRAAEANEGKDQTAGSRGGNPSFSAANPVKKMILRTPAQKKRRPDTVLTDHESPVSDRRLVLYEGPAPVTAVDPSDEMVCTYHCRQMVISPL